MIWRVANYEQSPVLAVFIDKRIVRIEGIRNAITVFLV